MANSTIKTYLVSDTANSSVNLEKLNIEIEQVGAGGYQGTTVSNGEIFVRYSNGINAANLLLVDAVVSAHDGEEAVTNFTNRNTREELIASIQQVLIYNGISQDDINDYITSISGEINSFVFNGFKTNITDKVTADSQVGEPFETFLATTINTELGDIATYINDQINSL